MNSTNATSASSSSSSAGLPSYYLPPHIPDIPRDLLKIIGQYLRNETNPGLLPDKEMKALYERRIVTIDAERSLKWLMEDDSEENFCEFFQDRTMFDPRYPQGSYHERKANEFHLQTAAETFDIAKLKFFLDSLPDSGKSNDIFSSEWVGPDPVKRIWKKIETNNAFWGVHHLVKPYQKIIVLSPAVRAAIHAAHANRADTLEWIFQNYLINCSNLADISNAALNHPNVHYIIAKYAARMVLTTSDKNNIPSLVAIMEKALYCLASTNQWQHCSELFGQIVDEVVPFIRPIQINCRDRTADLFGPIVYQVTPIRIDCRHSFNAAVLCQNESAIMGMLNAPPEIFITGRLRDHFERRIIANFVNDSSLQSRIYDRSKSDSEATAPEKEVFDPTPVLYSAMRSKNWNRVNELLPCLTLGNLVMTTPYVWDIFFEEATNNGQREIQNGIIKLLLNILKGQRLIPHSLDKPIYLEQIEKRIQDWSKVVNQASI